MMENHSKKIIDELCLYLGQDLDHPMCKELKQHINECPECRMYLNTVKLTVSLCREHNENRPLPDNVKKDLLKTLKLDR